MAKENENATDNAVVDAPKTGAPETTVLNAEPGSAKKNIEQPVAAVKQVADKMVAPKSASYSAQIIEVNEAENGNFALTLALPDGSTKIAWINAGYWDRLSKRFGEGDHVEVIFEERIEGKTTYESTDQPGTLYFHTKTGEQFSSMRKISAGMFNKLTPPNQLDLTEIKNAGEAMGPVANYLAAVRSAEIGAAAKA